MNTPALNKPTFLWEDKKTPVKVFQALYGPASGGKSFTGLRLASIYAKDQPFLAIDTEDHSLRLYQDYFPNATILNLNAYSQKDYKEAIIFGIKELQGPPVVYIDSISDEWDGKGGVIDQHDQRTQKGEDTFNAWNGPKQEHTQFIKWLRGLPCGVVVTMRSKDKIEKPKKGQPPAPVQIVPIQDGKILNQFDLVAYVSNQGKMKIVKSRLLNFIPVEARFDRDGNPEPARPEAPALTDGKFTDLVAQWQEHHNG